MQRSQTPLIFGLIVVLGGTIWLLSAVLDQRFESGTVYPVYSTQRSDPLGAKALMESLDRLPGVECEQNFLTFRKLEGSPDKTLFFLNMSPSSWIDGHFVSGKLIEKYAASGGRVVMTLNGQLVGMAKIEEEARQRQLKEEKEELKKLLKEKGLKSDDKDPDKKSEAEKDTDDNAQKKGDSAPLSKNDEKSDDEPANTHKEESQDSDKKQDDSTADNKEEAEDKEQSLRSKLLETPDSLEEVFGISLIKESFTLTPKGGHELKTGEESQLLSMQLPKWYSKSTLQVLEKDGSDAWKVLATLHDKPVIIERKIGTGSLVLCTDSFFASNEALWKEPSPGFLLWLTGGRKNIIFDEVHLGTLETPGIMHLARKLNMHGFFIGGLVLFALFVWQSMSSLVPQRERSMGDGSVSGQSATAGLVSLLRRGIPKSKLLQKSFEAWERGAATQSAAMKSRTEQARALLPPQGVKPGKEALKNLYRQISEILHTRRN